MVLNWIYWGERETIKFPLNRLFKILKNIHSLSSNEAIVAARVLLIGETCFPNARFDIPILRFFSRNRQCVIVVLFEAASRPPWTLQISNTFLPFSPSCFNLLDMGEPLCHSFLIGESSFTKSKFYIPIPHPLSMRAILIWQHFTLIS